VKQSGSLLAVLLLPAVGCLAGERQDWKTNTLAPGLTIQAPAGVKMTRQRPTGDFDILTFKRESKTILSVYLGNQPDFPRKTAGSSFKEETVNGLKTESRTKQEADAAASRDVLFHLREDGTWPQRLHCWYVRSGALDSAEADQMISTVRLAAAPREKSPKPQPGTLVP
jgi:hypothetical protein